MSYPITHEPPKYEFDKLAIYEIIHLYKYNNGDTDISILSANTLLVHNNL